MPIFDVFVCFIREQVATMKVKKNPGKPGNSWLAIIDRLRTETYEEVINLTGLLDELTTHTT